MKKMTDKEKAEALDFFMRYDVPEEENFNEARNRAIIEKTIRENDALMKKREKEYNKVLDERTEMVAMFMKAKADGGRMQKGGGIESYLGKRIMAKLRGEQIVRQLQDRLMVINKFGKVIRKPGEVTIRKWDA